MTIRRITLGPTEAERVAVTDGLAARRQDRARRRRRADRRREDRGDRRRHRAEASAASGLAPAVLAEAAGRRRPSRRRRRRRSAMNISRAVHPSAGRHGAADGGAPAVGPPRLPAAAGLGAAAGRLPDDPHRHLLSGREPGSHDERGDRAARAPVRPDARPGADVVDQLRRRVGDHAAVHARKAARRRRAGSAGGDQRAPTACCRTTCRSRRSTTRSTRPTRRC